MELVFIDELSLNEEEKAYLKSARDQIKANKSRKAELEAKIASMKSVIDEYQKSIDVLENDVYDFIQKHK